MYGRMHTSQQRCRFIYCLSRRYPNGLWYHFTLATNEQSKMLTLPLARLPP